MNQIIEIIETTLEEHRDASTNQELAELLAQKLITASLRQLADVVGGNLDYDDDGRAVIRTCHFNESKTLSERVKDSWKYV